MNEIRNSKEGEPQSTSSSSSSSSTEVPQAVRWCPSQFHFSPYSPVADTDVKLRQSLRVAVRRPLVGRLTKDIVETYKLCNPHFHYSDELNPKRYLTSPSAGVLNDGHDNTNSDLILAVNYVLSNSGTQQRYIVKDILGHGTFGQVAKCWVPEIKSFLAVKVIKNQPAYHQQALVEVSILTTLNRKYDPEDKHHIVRIYDYFVFQQHLCIVFELLESNLYELVKFNQFRGLSLSVVQLFSKQILRGLSLMKDAGIIHCDLKPENILLCRSKPAQIKIIDFGSACTENRTVYSYIQSRYYRSPEVLLGYQYSTAIDMWSLGCIVAELFLGLPLFPGASEYDLLKRMIKILGGHPPDYVLKDAKNTNKFFKFVGNASHNEGSEHSNHSQSVYQALSEEEYEARESKKPSIGKEYFNHMNLEEIVTMYPYRRGLREEEIAKENEIRLALIDFLRGLVEFDPTKRWSPLQASKHPFVTGEPFTQPYKPLPETPRVPVSRNVNVDHHPAGGHWFAAGLSPNVGLISGRARLPMHNSPHFQVVSHGYSGSYGSLGSHGSYNENYGLGSSSYGSYGENNNMHAYFSPVGPSLLKSGIPILGSSPDARLRIPQLPHGHGLGVSPSAGNFVPMSLGSSPSQFTPPGSYGHISSGSPGQYGPTSPAKGSSGHGSPLGKGAALSHFNRRKNMGYSTSLHSQENSSISHWQGPIAESSSYRQIEPTSLGLGGMPLHLQSSANAPSWKQQQSGCGITPGHYVPHNVRGSFALGPNMQFSHLKGTAYDKPEASLDLPNPGDWDPNYSEDLLLQEDGSELGFLASDFNKNLHFNPGLPPLASSKHNYVSGMTSGMSIQRPNGSIQSFSHGEDGNPSSHHDMYGGTRHLPKTSHISSNSPSRLGQQQPIHRFNNQGRSTAIKVQPSPSGFNFGGPLSPGGGSSSSPFGSGRRGNHPVTNIPPTSRGRKDYSGFA